MRFKLPSVELAKGVVVMLYVDLFVIAGFADSDGCVVTIEGLEAHPVSSQIRRIIADLGGEELGIYEDEEYPMVRQYMLDGEPLDVDESVAQKKSTQEWIEEAGELRKQRTYWRMTAENLERRLRLVSIVAMVMAAVLLVSGLVNIYR